MTHFYVAGKNLKRAALVMNTLRANGYDIAYDWLTTVASDASAEKAISELNAVRAATALIYLWEPDQESARYEAGMAMGLGKTIIVSGKSDAFFFQLPNVHCVELDEKIVELLRELYPSMPHDLATSIR